MAAKNLDEHEFVSINTIAKDLDCSRRTVERWCANGELECFTFMGRRLIKRDYYQTWKQQRAIKKVIK